MWPFKKEQLLVDTTEFIALADGFALPLICDFALYQSGLKEASTVIESWINQELDNNTALSERIQSSIVFELRKFDLKYLPYPVQINSLESVLMDTELSNAGSRFFDMIVELYTKVPTEVLETYRGKFLHAMLYGLPRNINDKPLPNKEAWTILLSTHPWVPFIKLIQDIFETKYAPKLTQRASS
jgi:hypothetical protein